MRLNKVALLFGISLSLTGMSTAFAEDAKAPKKTEVAAPKLPDLLNQLKAEPNNLDLIVKIGQAYQFSGQPQQAVEFLKKYKKQFPDNPQIAIWHANAESLLAGSSQDVNDKVRWSQLAIADLDETVGKFPDNWFVHYLRGKNSMGWPDMFKRKSVAIKDFEFLLTLHAKDPKQIPAPLLPEIHHSLAQAYVQTGGDVARAKELIATLKSKFPESEQAKSLEKDPVVK